MYYEKKMISLAVIFILCAERSGFLPMAQNDGHRPGQQQVWQNGPKQGDQNGHHQPGGPGDHHQGNNDSRGPDRRGHDDRHRERHEQDHFARRGNDFRKGHPAPEHYRGDEYRVSNWNERGLPRPRRGITGLISMAITC